MFWFFFPEETRHLQLFIFYYYYFAILRRFTTPKKKNLYLVLWYCQIWLYFSFCFLDGVTFGYITKFGKKKKGKKHSLWVGFVVARKRREEEEDDYDDDDDVVVSFWDLKKEVEKLGRLGFCFPWIKQEEVLLMKLCQKKIGFSLWNKFPLLTDHRR